jgi:hypothetical protein
MISNQAQSALVCLGWPEAFSLLSIRRVELSSRIREAGEVHLRDVMMLPGSHLPPAASAARLPVFEPKARILKAVAVACGVDAGVCHGQ